MDRIKGRFIKGHKVNLGRRFPYGKGKYQIRKVNPTWFSKGSSGFNRRHTLESKKIMSLAQQERYKKFPYPHKGQKNPKISGKNHWNWKGGLVDAKKQCTDCGIEINRFSLRCKPCLHKMRKQEKHPNWQGGISNLPYSFEFNKDLKEKIRKRDNYQCQNKECNMTEEEHLIVYGKVLTVHHIDYDKKNHNDSNLIALCTQCNFRVNWNRTYWQEYFSKIIDEVIYVS